jgi:hypothetical protein
MRTRHLHRLTALMMGVAVAATIGCSADRPAAAAAVPASSSASASPPANTLSVKAHWENPPDSFTLTAPCTQTDYIPKSGLCHGTGAGKATISGSWQGITTYEYGFATTPANLTYFTITETFEGTVTGCGTGAMTYRLAGTVDSGGKILDDWNIVEGFGSGDLARVTGHGTQLGTYNPDFSQSGDFSGDLACR